MAKNFISVYRIENENGLGPYRFAKLNKEISNPQFSPMYDAHQVDDYHVSACDDFGYPIYGIGCDINYPTYYCLNKDFSYGCNTLEKLLTWFDGYIDSLLDSGFNIVEYTIHKKHVYFSKSENQIAFNKQFVIKKTNYKFS